MFGVPAANMAIQNTDLFIAFGVRWDDRAMTPGSPLEKEVTELLQQPVTWSAPHLGADGEKNWVDIVTDTEKDAK